MLVLEFNPKVLACWSCYFVLLCLMFNSLSCLGNLTFFGTVMVSLPRSA